MFGNCWTTDDTQKHVKLTSKCTDVWRYGGTRFPEAPHALWHESSENRVVGNDAVKGLKIKNGLADHFKNTWVILNETFVQTNGGLSKLICLDVDEESGIVKEGDIKNKNGDEKNDCLNKATTLMLLPGEFL